MMSNGIWMRARRVVVASAVGALALGALPGTVDAQQLPTAEASVTCTEGDGFIDVAIVDDFRTTYNVLIDGEIVDEGVTDSDDGVYTYGPFDDGIYNVVVYWVGGSQDILDTDLTVDCVPDDTTTTTTGEQATSTTVAVARVAAQPRFTG